MCVRFACVQGKKKGGRRACALTLLMFSLYVALCLSWNPGGEIGHRCAALKREREGEKHVKYAIKVARKKRKRQVSM